MKVPEGWAEARLGELVHIRSGYAPSAAQSGGTGEYGYVRVDDLNASSKYITGGRDRATAPSNGIVPSGSVMFPKRGAAISTNKVRLAACELLMDTNMMALTVRPHRLDAEFLYYLLVHEKLYRIADTSTIPQINNKHIEPYRIALPPLPEQRRIAEILGAWDEAIALVERRLAAARERKRGLAQRLLTGQVRFPGFTEPWREVRLGELGQCLRGVSYKPEDLRTTDGRDTVRLVRANNIVSDGLDLTDIQVIDAARAKRSQLLRDGDIAICMSSGSRDLVGKASAYQDSDGHSYVVGAFCAIYRPQRGSDAALLDQIFQSELYRRQTLVVGAGTNIRNLKPSDIEGIALHLPTKQDECQRIAQALGTCDIETAGLSAKLAALQAQKRGLMQRLLTGEVRVRV